MRGSQGPQQQVSPAKGRRSEGSCGNGGMVWLLLGGLFFFLIPMVVVIYVLTPGHDLADISWNTDSRSIYHKGMKAATLRGVMVNLDKEVEADPAGKGLTEDLEEISIEGISDFTAPVTDPSYTIRAQAWEHGKIFHPKLLHYPPDITGTENMTYPVYHNLNKIIEDWNPDDPDPPSHFVETLQHFNYSDDRERAMAANFRNHEVPFKVYNVPEFERVRSKWSDDYLTSVLGDNLGVHVEHSDTNHFMYWSGKKMKDWEPPTEVMDKGEMMWGQWLKHAKKADREKPDNKKAEHYYFMHSAMRGDHRNTFIARDLPVFSSGKKNFFIVAPEKNKGIQCRFGMRGIIAEGHYDGGRNNVAMLKGTKRYILTPPTECDYLDLIKDRKHPSYRHSQIDWSDPKVAKSKLSGAKAIDTIVREGEMLYIPSYWIHYIISLNYSVQCNSRSGPPPDDKGLASIEACMGSGNVNSAELQGMKKGRQGGKKAKRAKKRKAQEQSEQLPP